MFAIIISEKGGAERREVFDRPEIGVGRVQGNDLTLPKGNVSKRHARLVYRDDRFIVTDLNSTNGTYVNRRRISQPTIVREGDKIYIGDFVLRIEPASAHKDAPENEAQARAPNNTTRGSQESGTRTTDVGAQGGPELSVGARVSIAGRPEIAPDSPDLPAGAPLRPPPPEPSRPSLLTPRRVTASIPDPEALVYRAALSALVERVESALEPGDLDGDLVGLSSRVSQLLTDQSSRLRAEGRLPTNIQLDGLLVDARAELLGKGPIDALLSDNEVAEIVVSRYDNVIALRGGEAVRVEPPFTSEVALQRAIRRVCDYSGAAIRSGERVIERRLPGGGVLTAALAPTSVRGTVAVLRKLRDTHCTLDELVRSGIASAPLAAFLEQCVAARVNLLVAGPRDVETFKVVSALCAAGSSAGHVIVQRTSEVVPTEDATLFSVTGELYEASRLVELAAQVPGAKVVVELASPELCESLVSAVASGVEGALGVVYASNLRRALARLPADLMAARSGLVADAAREWIAASFDLAIEVGRLADGHSRILRVSEILGTGGGGILTQEIFSFMIDHATPGSALHGSFVPSGTIPRLVPDLQARGLTVDTSVFSRPR